METNTQKQANEDILNIIYQTASMGEYAANKLLPAVKDDGLLFLLTKEIKLYEKHIKLCEQYANQLNIQLKDVNIMLKASSWTSIKIKSMLDNSTAHLAEMLIQGANMGVTTLIKEKSQCASLLQEKIKVEATDLQQLLETFVTSLKHFLTK